MAILEVEHLEKRFGGTPVLQDVSFTLEQGQTLAVLHTNRPETLADAERVFLEAIRWGTDAPEAQPLIYGIVK